MGDDNGVTRAAILAAAMGRNLWQEQADREARIDAMAAEFANPGVRPDA